MQYTVEDSDRTSKDLSSVRTVTLEDGQIMRLKRTDPFGHWHVHFDKGQVPTHLGGAYTTYPKALDAVLSYLTEKKRSVKSINEKASRV